MRLVKHRGKWAVYAAGRRLSTGLADTGDNRDAAERKAREITAALTSAVIDESCGSIVRAYMTDMPLRANPRTPSESYRLLGETACKFFANHKPAEVTRTECRAYAERRRKEGRADGTIRTELAVLAAALRWRDKNTPAEFDFPAPSQPRERWLTRDEFKRLLEAAERPHIKTFLNVAICTGARKEAILTLRWDTHVDFERRTVWPGFKAGGKNRAQPIPMTDACFEHLKKAYEGRESGWVVEWAGDRVLDVKKALRAAYVRAGLADVGAPAHALRHTAGAWMAIDGVAMHEIARRLGHSTIRVTEKHYAHLHPDYMGASTAALEV